MRVLLIILAGVASLALVLFALGVFDPASTPTREAPAVTDGGSPTADGGDPALVAGREVPTEEPELHVRKLEAAVNVLVLSKRPTSWSVFLQGAIEDSREVQYATWYTDSADAQDPDAPPGPGRNRGIELTAAPTAADLKRLDIEIVVLDAIDPNALPGDFWDLVAENVATGGMGLWVLPGWPIGAGGEAQTAHPVLSHPTLKPLLPVAAGEPLQGTPVPGTFSEGAKMALTDAGARHPATRFTPYPKWAYHFWGRRSEGEHAWKPKFCYPIKELAAGAVSLVDVMPTPVDRRPAIVVSDKGVGRVLWQGNFDFGHRAYFSATATKPIGVLVNRILIWLSGRAAP